MDPERRSEKDGRKEGRNRIDHSGNKIEEYDRNGFAGGGRGMRAE
jgi:hypothetical protein